MAFRVNAVAYLFSVFAGPTRSLVREDSPALDLFRAILPTFDQPLGFALGAADFVFLALFAAMLVGLLLEACLPALLRS